MICLKGKLRSFISHYSKWRKKKCLTKLQKLAHVHNISVQDIEMSGGAKLMYDDVTMPVLSSLS